MTPILRVVTAAAFLLALPFNPALATQAQAQAPAQAPAPLSTSQVPVPQEKNPPGDIPDTQAFVAYRSPLGFVIKAPEGWSRRTSNTGVGFSHDYDFVGVDVIGSANAPTAASVRQHEIPALERLPVAVRISQVASVDLPAGPAVMIAYTSNSLPSPVTNKAIRLENVRYLVWSNGHLATVTLSAPAGADNADQWLLVARSFQWQ